MRGETSRTRSSRTGAEETASSSGEPAALIHTGQQHGQTQNHKPRRPFGDPVAAPKEHPSFERLPPITKQSFNLPVDAIIPNPPAEHLVFHCVGDTGGIYGPDVQTAIAETMELQIKGAPDGEKPLFFYHLGDVVYFNGQSTSYPEQFYEPYKHYPGEIFAIAGNHDGDTHVRRNDAPDHEPSLYGFMLNFCDDQRHRDYPYRDTMTQPYVYWTLETPVATIIGLYSNVDGTLDGRGTRDQEQWLKDQIDRADDTKWLLVTVHHPPYSLDSEHGGYLEVGAAIDRASANRKPDMVLSGHVHSYQRFTRSIGNQRQIPYLIAGAGGYANAPGLLHRLQRDPGGAAIQVPFQTTDREVVLSSYNTRDPGFLRVTAQKGMSIRAEYFTVPFNHFPTVPFPSGGGRHISGGASGQAAHPEFQRPPGEPFDVFTLDWATHRVTNGS